jgi:hypothetical protein
MKTEGSFSRKSLGNVLSFIGHWTGKLSETLSAVAPPWILN